MLVTHTLSFLFMEKRDVHPAAIERTPAESATTPPETQPAAPARTPSILVGPRSARYKQPHTTIWEASFCGRNALVKCNNTYTAASLQREVRATLRARKLGIRTPVIYHVDLDACSLCMECVVGVDLEAFLKTDADTSAKRSILADLGRCVAGLHDGGLTHGDLRPSHCLLRQGDNALILLDFSKAEHTIVPEQRAADLHRLEASLLAAHPEQPDLFAAIADAYKKRSRFWSATFNRMNAVKQKANKRAKVC